VDLVLEEVVVEVFVEALLERHRGLDPVDAERKGQLGVLADRDGIIGREVDLNDLGT